MTHYFFSCPQCPPSPVDEVTFDQFLTKELQKLLKEKTRGRGGHTATLRFETICPLCSPKGDSVRELSVRRFTEQ